MSRKLAFALAAAALCLAPAGAAHASETVTRVVVDKTAAVRSPGMPTGLSAKTAIVIDGGNGRALFAVRPRKRRLIASTTKIMTALVAISRTRPDQVLTATTYRPGAGESVLGLRPGERMTAQDLLRALLMVSANDAADTFAARTASSRAAFVAAMNRRARALGLRSTHYGNPVGLDVPRTYSTAHDLAKLTRAAMREPRFRSVVGRAHATLRSGALVRHIGNRNDLVGRYRYVDGVKTGHTLAAGYLLVGAAHKRDAEVISVVTGEPSLAARSGDTLKLLRFGRGFFTTAQPLARRRELLAIPIALQDARAAVYPVRDVGFAVRDGERYTVTLTAPRELEGPLVAGTQVGTAMVARRGRTLAVVPVEVRQAIPAPAISAVMLHQLGRLLPLVALLAIAFMMGVVILRRRSAQVQSMERGAGEAIRPTPAGGGPR